MCDFPMTRLSSPSLELSWGTCLCEKCSNVERESCILTAWFPASATSRQVVPKTCHLQIWLLACYQPALLVRQRFSAHYCLSLAEPTHVQWGRCAATTAEGQTRLGSSCRSSWGKIPVPPLLMCLDMGMHWHTFCFFLGKLKGTIPLKSLAAIEAAAIGL